MVCAKGFTMSILDIVMRFFNRHWVATNWGPRVGQQQGTACPLHGYHSASRDYGA